MGSGKQFRHLFDPLSDLVNPVTVDMSFDGTAGKNPFQSGKEEIHNQEAVKTLVSVLDQVVSSQLQPGPIVLGYSMGGRLALSWATNYPGHVTGLILESTTAGIAGAAEREKRRVDDAARAARIRSNFIAFLDEWEQNPLFRGSEKGPVDPDPALKSQIQEIQRNQSPEQLSRWLQVFGTGKMPPVWDRLNRIASPVLLITGEEDTKFTSLAKRMNSMLPESKLIIVPGAAHRVHIDAPDAYLSYLLEFIRRLH